MPTVYDMSEDNFENEVLQLPFSKFKLESKYDAIKSRASTIDTTYT